MKPGANALGISRPAIALKLLAHGPLSAAEFRVITGWKNTQCEDVLAKLRRRHALQRRIIGRRRVYAIPNAPYAEACPPCA